MIQKIFRIPFIVILLITVMTGCSSMSLPGLPGTSKDTIRVTTLGTGESEIVSELVKEMIEHYSDLNVTQFNNLASSLSHHAMKRGDIDIDPTRYTGTDITDVLGMDPVSDREEAMKIVKQEFDERFNETYFESYGYENSYTIVVNDKVAEEFDLKKISDLKSHASELQFAVDDTWLQREGDGYEAFKEKYGFEFGKAYAMQMGLVYKAVGTDNMDVAMAYSSDGRIAGFNLKELEDDKQFFPAYDVAPVIRNETLKKYPELKTIMQKLAGKIDVETMREMNYLVDVEHEDSKIVAQKFLKENNYFENE